MNRDECGSSLLSLNDGEDGMKEWYGHVVKSIDSYIKGLGYNLERLCDSHFMLCP